MMRVRTLGSLAASAFLIASLVVVPFLPAAGDESPAGLVMTLRGHKEAVYAIAFTGDGKQIVTGSGDPSIKVWQADTGKEFKTFAGTNGHTGLVLSLALSPDGTQIASGGADNTLRVWDFPMTKHLREFALATDSRSVAVSPDGLRVAGGSDAGVVRVWTTADGKQLHEMTGHTGAVTGLAFNPNGQTIASVGHDGTLRYWNANDGKSLGAFVAHPGPVSGVAFNVAGSLVFTTGSDGTLRYWSLPTNNWGATTPIQLYGTQYKINDCRQGTCFPGYLYFNGYIPANRINTPTGVSGIPSSYVPAVSPINPIPASGVVADPNFNDNNNVFVTLKNGTKQLVAFDNGLNPWRNQVLPGPWITNMTASLYKSVAITEQVNLRISLDAFNVFNQPGIGLPGGDGIISLRTSAQGARTMQYTARLTW